jgi:hypothetical protein
MLRWATWVVASALLFGTGCVGRISGGAKASGPNGGGPVCGAHPYGARTELHRLTPLQYQHAISDIFGGQVAASSLYPGAYGQSVTGYSTEEAINEVGDQSTEQLMNAAEAVALEVATAMPALLPCSAGSSPDLSCVGTYLDTVGRLAYRRPLTSDERTALTATFQTAQAGGATFAEAVAILTAHLLQSPQFLYWVEDAAGTGRALTGYELASRLSLMFWDSVPDEVLLTAAANGQLDTPDAVAAQAQRMLASPKANTTLARWMREWTQTAALTASNKDATVYPFFTAAYAQSMNDSFDLFAVDQLRNQGTLSTLLTSPEAFVDANLASAYGVPAPASGQWQKVSLDPTRYAGVLSQALVLATNAHPNTSSYVYRGRTLRKRVLCEPFPAPPANAQTTFATLTMPANPTGKQTSAVVQSQPACASCHSLIDPGGLSFEHFDGAGSYRGQYASGKSIDPSGTTTFGGQTVTFSSNVDLAAQVAQLSELEQCVGAQLFRFTFSRMETADDACTVQPILDALHASGGNLGTALLAVTATDAFSYRVDP